MEPIISILICSLHKRTGMLASLLRNIEEQVKKLDVEDLVEILVNVDGGEKPTGTKRNELLQQAKGKYVLAVDDDDKVPAYFIEELLAAAQSNADCFATTGIMTTDGLNEQFWEISKDFEYQTLRDEQGKVFFRRFPNHISPIKREIASKFKFPDLYVFEDHGWAVQIHESGLIKTEYKITRHPMYHYDFKKQKA